ncbi:hypothetical protein Tco_1118642, partial [Tanacetum coccineum]
NDQEKEDNVNSTNNVNAISINKVNVVGGKTSIILPFDPDMPALEDYSIFDFTKDDEDVKGMKVFSGWGNHETKFGIRGEHTNIPKAMKEELLQFKLQEVWTLVDLPNRKRAIGTKWVFRNKKDESGIVIRNKARLVAQGYTQEERIDYDEVFVLVARIEAIRLFLAYASFKDFMVIEDPDFPDIVYKVEKHLMDYIKLLELGMKHCQHICRTMGFKEGKLTRPYSSKGTKQKKDGIFISQDKYVIEILKKFGFMEVKTASTSMETQKPLLKYEDGEEVDVYMYTSMIGSLMYLTSSRPDIMFEVCACARYQVNPKVSHLYAVKRIFSDYAGASLDRKSTTGGCQFLGCRLISWQCKKQTVCMTRSSTKELLSPFENPKQKFRSRRRLFDTPSLVESNSPEFNHNFDILEQSEEEVRETMTETMEQYMSKTQENYGSGVTRPTINQDTPFELKGQFLKELRDNTFSGSEHEDANEHIEKVLEIVDLFHIPKVTQDQIMLRAFSVCLTEAASRWLRNQASGSITTWEVLKIKFLNKYCPPARTAKKMEEINNFQQEPDESLFYAWERFKELLMKCPQHYLTDMQEGAIPSKNAADAKIAIQEMAEYSQKWHNGTSSRTRSTKTSDGLAAIQAQLNNLGREIKKVNEKVYAAQVGCELCKGPHYTKGCPQKEEGKTLEEAYYTQFGAPYQPRGQYRAARPGFYQRNNGNSSIRRIGCGTYAVSDIQQRSILSETVPFPNRLQNFSCDDWREAQDVKILDAYDHTLPPKEKDSGSFTLPCFIHNICFDKALVDLGASFTIVDDDDMAKDVVLGMKFCKKYVSCQMIMKKFALGEKCEQIMKDE